ncbi:TRAP-delta domain containing protein [Asbolus verrucosus]|uniref:Translocon-associated protein subunit delta n=1 Tax=Asbolus verrucosus TaxID=1661398 RepID=A0A482VT43_ASBVE|nr:TRAP-delta domain containing protein [Asbolus verrucosus]
MSKIFLIVACVAFATTALCESCTNPQITSTSFTTQDATIVTNIAYISDFTLKCGNGEASTLYAEINGNIVPVSIVGENQYQVSWTEDTKTARSGDKVVRIFDEDGYAALRKALRAGEGLASVQSLSDVVINHPGAYNGPWLQSELLATIISLIIAYFAISFKLKVTA